MDEQQNGQEIDLEKSPYIGHAVPKVLRFAYLGFGVWAVTYAALYLLPNLIKWLSK